MVAHQPLSSEPFAMSYADRQHFFKQLLTVFGRKTVLEALQETAIPAYRLHLAKSNRSDATMNKIIALAEAREIEIRHHSRQELSRISRNQRQDQGVALDLQCPNYGDYRKLLQEPPKKLCLIALDRITNPQNLGMVIRSICASPIDGLLLPSKGCAPLSPLVIKASAGTLFRCPIYRCDSLSVALNAFAELGSSICTLNAAHGTDLAAYKAPARTIYVLGNETDGVSQEVNQLATEQLNIPMANEVESLNVAVTAALLAFRQVIAKVD